MGWGMLAAVLDHMRDRLEAGSRADLLEMAQVTYVKGWTARLLRDNGFRNLRALAEANPKDIVPVLMMVSTLSKSAGSNSRLVIGKPAQEKPASSVRN
jgi:DNA polymerase theta